METSSVLAGDEAPPLPTRPLPLPLPNENGNDAGAGGPAVESGTREGLVEAFRHRVDNLNSKADELEQMVNEIVQFYASKNQPNSSKGSPVVKDKDKEKTFGVNNSINIANNSGSNSNAKKKVDGCRKEVVCSKRMGQLMHPHQFGTILKQLDELNLHLEELRESVVQRCRKMSTDEKRKLGMGLSSLSPEDLNKALEIIAQHNPSFQATAEEVDLDMDAQSESTLWKLKFFVRSALELQAKNSASKADGNSKRKKEKIPDALAKTAKKRNKKLSS